ncbi:MAG TPA: hypothetical protein VF254_02510 [Gammaproteobacteria bacterium]
MTFHISDALPSILPAALLLCLPLLGCTTTGATSGAQDKVNALLQQHPASETLCGEKRSRLSVEGERIVLESAWSQCAGADRSTARAADLDAAAIEVELLPEYGQARIYIPCRGDRPCSPRFTRGEGETEWRHLRDETALTIDTAPDAEAAYRIVQAVREVLDEMKRR